VKFNLGDLVPAVRGWVVCVDERDATCSICVELPEWLQGLGSEEKVYVALYLVARATLDYRVAAAMHVFSLRSGVTVKPELLSKAAREATVSSAIPRALDEHPYAWQAALWRGIAYAQAILDLESPALVKVKPPEDRRQRKRLRVALEGKRPTASGPRRGLVERLGGEKVAPWTYLIPKKNLPALIKALQSAEATAAVRELGVTPPSRL